MAAMSAAVAPVLGVQFKGGVGCAPFGFVRNGTARSTNLRPDMSTLSQERLSQEIALSMEGGGAFSSRPKRGSPKASCSTKNQPSLSAAMLLRASAVSSRLG